MSQALNVDPVHSQLGKSGKSETKVLHLFKSCVNDQLFIVMHLNHSFMDMYLYLLLLLYLQLFMPW